MKYFDLLYGENLKSFEYSLVYAKTLGGKDSNQEILPVIMCNNNLIEEDNYLSILNFDIDTFGVYNLVFYYKFDFFDLVYSKDIFVDSNVVVDNDNYYNTGLILTFKGKAYLNDLIIESGYIINEEGEYNLKLIGHNDETKIFNFTVVNQQNNKKLIDSYDLNFTLKIEEEDIDEHIKINHNAVINNIVSKDYDNNIWYIIIPICTLLVSVSTFTFIGRKIK